MIVHCLVGLAHTKGTPSPVVSCFNSQQELDLFRANTMLEGAFNVPPDPTSDTGYAAIVSQYRTYLALYETQYKLCENALGEELLYMGTTTVVRDLDFMAQFFDGPGAPM